MADERTLASDLFKNYLADEWVELVDFDSLKGESTETVDRDLSELRADLRSSAKFKGTDEEAAIRRCAPCWTVCSPRRRGGCRNGLRGFSAGCETSAKKID